MDFPEEAIRMLKEKDIKAYGDAAQSDGRLVLEKWDELEG